MRRRDRMPARIALIAAATAALCAGLAPAASAKVPVKFKTMAGYPSPGTPPNLNVVGVLKTGDPKARNVLVLNPGTSASAAYFEPLARTIVKRLRDWQVWAVERRENYLEDQSELDLVKQGKVSPTDFFNYYLGYIGNSSVDEPLQPGPGLGGPVRAGVGDEHRDQRPARRRQGGGQARPEGGDGRPLARRLDRHRLRDLGLPRPARRPGTSRASS